MREERPLTEDDRACFAAPIEPVIDCHCHVLPEELLADLPGFASVDSYFANLTTTKGGRFASGEDLVREMDASGISKAIAFGFASSDPGINRIQNDYVSSLCKKYPGKLLGLGVLSPACAGFVEEAVRCLSMGLVGFGELFPAGHGYALEGPEAARLAAIAVEAEGLLLFHVNEDTGHSYPGKGNVGPGHAYRFAAANPEARVVFAHFGGGLPFYWTMPEVRALKNVYYDTAAQPYLYEPRVYNVLKETGALGKIVLGSDYPLLTCKRYIRDMRNSGLPDSDILRMVAGNAGPLVDST